MDPASAGSNALYCPKCDSNVVAASSKCHTCGLTRPDRGWPLDHHISAVVAEKYRIIERIGRGGMGSVYLAEQTYEGASLGQVAVKFLQPRGTKREQEFLKKKFISEAGFARLFNSPHITKVYDFGTWEGETFMAMEFLQGESMDDRLLRNETLKAPMVVELARQIAEALTEVHRHDVVHRDIKPENILLLKVEGKDFVKILDFGIAKRIDPMGGQSSTQIGTPVYMPPEQIHGKAVDARADLYSLGVMMYKALTGDPPMDYDSLDDQQMIEKISNQVHDIGHVRAGLPEKLRILINSMIHPEPNRRPQNAEVVVKTLKSLQKEFKKEDDEQSKPSIQPVASRGDQLYKQVYGTATSPSPVNVKKPRTPPPVDFTSSPSRGGRGGRIVKALLIILVVGGLVALADWVYIHYIMNADPGDPLEIIRVGDEPPIKDIPFKSVNHSSDTSTDPDVVEEPKATAPQEKKKKNRKKSRTPE